jgi:WhiB family redox-sensing transcriptional regulator
VSPRDAAVTTLWIHRQRDLDVPSLDELIDRPAWHAYAACRGMGPDLFFGSGRPSTRRIFLLCSGCPVQQECRDAGDQDSLEYGVWGGMNATDRAKQNHIEAS